MGLLGWLFLFGFVNLGVGFGLAVSLGYGPSLSYSWRGILRWNGTGGRRPSPVDVLSLGKPPSGGASIEEMLGAGTLEHLNVAPCGEPYDDDVVALLMPAEPGVLDRDEKGDHGKAIADHTEAIRLNPKDAKAYHSRGTAYFKLGRLDEAFADYSAALGLAPADADARVSRGLIHAVRGDFEAAIADYDEAIRIQPDHAKAHGNRAVRWRAKATASVRWPDTRGRSRSIPRTPGPMPAARSSISSSNSSTRALPITLKRSD